MIWDTPSSPQFRKPPFPSGGSVVTSGIASCTRSQPIQLQFKHWKFLRFGQGYASYVAAVKGQELNQPNHLGYKSRGGRGQSQGWFFSPGAGRLRTTGSFGGGRLLCAALRLCDLTHLAQPCFERENLEFDNRFASHQSTIQRGFSWIYHELTIHLIARCSFCISINLMVLVLGMFSCNILQRNPGQHHDRGEERGIIRKIAFRCSFDLASGELT